MPPNEKCPACGIVVPDWHREWHSLEDQKRIFAGTAGMECPCCKANIAYGSFLALSVAKSNLTIVKREILKAAEWARISDGKSLQQYLLTTPGAPYNNLWLVEEITAADAKVAATPE
jgi:hypothetical protein